MPELGRFLILFGLALVVVGGTLSLFGRVPWIGRLPGDLYVQRGNFTFYFPLGTCILLSVVSTLLFWIFRR
jgi:Protein of unknown function (DUF2905)